MVTKVICNYEEVLLNDFKEVIYSKERISVLRRDPCGTQENKINFEDRDHKYKLNKKVHPK